MRRALLLALLALAAPSVAAAATPVMPSDDEIFQTIKDLTANGPRRQGTPALDKAWTYVRDHFKADGLSGVHVETAPTYSWKATSSSLSVAGKPVDAFPMAYSMSPKQTSVGDFSTPAGGLKGQLVDVGMGTPAELEGKDLKGKIAVFDLKFITPQAALAPLSEFLWDPDQTMTLDPQSLATANPYQSTYSTAIGDIINAGATGVIGVLADYYDSDRYYNEYYRSLNVSIPGMWVTKTTGAQIRAAMAADPSASATMVLTTHKDRVAGHAVVGYLQGASNDTILVTSHHDSVWDGAVEDGSGASEVLALAKYYAQQPASTRSKTLMFVTFDSHFSGYQVHEAFVKRHVDGTDPHHPVAVVTLEHVAKQAKADAAGKLYLTGLPEVRGVFENLQAPLKATIAQALMTHDLRRSVMLNAEPLQPVGMPTDSSWALLAGLATVSFISGPLYLYDRDDTLDKVQKDDLQRVALTFADVIDAIDTTPSSQLALPPPYPQHASGDPTTDSPDSLGNGPDNSAGTPCRAARSGRPVSGVRLRRTGRRVVVRFHARRATTVTVRGRRGSRRVARERRVRPCADYAVALPRGTRRLTLTWPGGRVRVR